MRRNVNLLRSTDWVCVMIYLLLVFFGWLSIYAAVFDAEKASFEFFFRQQYGNQVIWIGISLLTALILFTIDSKVYTFFAWFIYGFIILLLFLVLIFGKKVNGARSWFDIGGFALQPSEFAKFATSLALAKYLNSFNVRIQNIQNVVASLGIIFLPIVLILLQPDAGSAIVYTVFFVVLYREGLSGIFLLIGTLAIVLFLMTLKMDSVSFLSVLAIAAFAIYIFIRKRYKEAAIALGIFGSLFAVLVYIPQLLKHPIPIYNSLLISLILSCIVFIFFAFRKQIKYVSLIIAFMFSSLLFSGTVNYVFNNIMSKHQQTRLLVVLGMKDDPKGAGYNVNQSKIAIGSGGVIGKGFLQGTQTKFNFVPEQSTDFIFCTVGEEWGFVGSITVLILFLALLLRLIFLAERQRSVFSRIYGYSVAGIIFFHLTINIGMTMGLLPVIGIPLPFFSYGGSSLISFTLLLFVFLRLDASRMELL